MFEIKAKNRYLDLSKSLKSLYILAIGVFLSVLTYFIYQDLIVTVTLAVCSVVAYLILSQKPKEIMIKIEEEGLVINTDKIGWEIAVGWAMVDLGDTLEFVIQTPHFVKDFYYFYIQETDPKVQQFLQILSQYLPYNEEIVAKNKTHNILRNLGLQ